MTTPNLGLPEMTPSDPNKFVSHNLMLRYVEALAGGGVEDIVNTPPVSPVNGDLYLVGTLPTGAFVGEENNYAYYDGGWLFIPPAIGVTTYVNSRTNQLFWNGSAWQGVYDLPVTVVSDVSVTGESYRTYALTSAVTSFTFPKGVTEGEQITIADYDGNFSTVNVPLLTTGGDTVSVANLTDDYSVTKFMYANGKWRQMGSPIELFSVGSPAPPGSGADITIYVANSTGLDTNDGLTIGTAVKTLPKAASILNNLDIDQFNVNISLIEDYIAFDSDVVYFGRYQGSGGVCTLSGNTTTRKITFDATYSIVATEPEQDALINFINNSFWLISNLTFDSSLVGAVENACIRVKEKSTLSLDANLRLLKGSTAGTEFMGIFDYSFVESYASTGITITLDSDSSNPISYFLRLENSNFHFGATVTISSGTYIVPTGKAFISLINSGAFGSFPGLSGTSVNSPGNKFVAQGNSFLFTTQPDPGGSAVNNISPQSILL